jgi:transposase
MQVLTPNLRPGDIVVMDNLSPHKMPAVIAAIEACGPSVWFLPPDSPDTNPIERCARVITALPACRASMQTECG